MGLSAVVTEPLLYPVYSVAKLTHTRVPCQEKLNFLFANFGKSNASVALDRTHVSEPAFQAINA
jgi:hypothetical protein